MANGIAQELAGILNDRKPDAAANIRGSRSYPSIRGEVLFYEMRQGVIVLADVRGLPRLNGNECNSAGAIYGFHIHEGSECTGNAQDPFANAGAHYNPGDCTHPYHAGDMPPLFECGGKALLLFFTDRFNVNEVIGRTVIIHGHPDDFTTQPSGDSGNKIACGVIMKR